MPPKTKNLLPSNVQTAELPGLNNYPSDDQISAWKHQYGRVYIFNFPERTKLVRNPDYNPESNETETIPNPNYTEDGIEPFAIPNPNYQGEFISELIAGPKFCIVRKPDRAMIAYAQTAFKKRELESDYHETLLNSVWLAGDPEIKTDGDYLLGVGPKIMAIIDIAECELEEL